jgi:hyaluronoglucosaminidase
MPLLGAIEGFYGRPWEPKRRLDMLRWLALLGFDAYLYAPKADSWLRKRWRDPWPASERRLLRDVAARCEESGLQFVVGLSPYAVYERYDADARRKLRTRVRQIADVGGAALALLFDDMPGGATDLAGRQAEICADVLAWSGMCALYMCPTYYSDDPVLDRVFGGRPVSYLETLGALLAREITPFWTGPEVCANSVSAEHLEDVRSRLRRPVALWDNYPVNDSKTRSAHLYLQGLAGRSTDAAAALQSHWCNAMNQPALSLPALASLPALYGRLDDEALARVYADVLLRTRPCGRIAPLERPPPGARAQQNPIKINPLMVDSGRMKAGVLGGQRSDSCEGRC